MSVEFHCIGCERRYRIADSAVERKMRCKACGAINLIEPSVQAEAAADTDPFANVDAFAEPRVASSVQYPPIYRAARKPLSAAPAFAHIPGEEAIDRFVPLAIILLFSFELIGMLWHDVSIVWAGLGMHKASVSDNMTSFGPPICRPLLLAVVAAVVTAPLLLLSVIGAARLLPFSLPSGLYLKSLAASCAAWGVALALSGFYLNQINTAVPITAGICVMLGVFWLLLRLRLERFAIAATGATLCCALAPVLLPLIGKPMGLTRREFMVVKTNAHGFESFSLDPRQVAAATDTSSDDDVRARLQEIWKVVSEYAENHGGQYPATLAEAGRDDLIRFKGDRTFPTFVFDGLKLCKAPLSAHFLVAEGPKHFNGTQQTGLVLWGDGTVSSVDEQSFPSMFPAMADAEGEARRWLLQDPSEPFGALAMFVSASLHGDAEAIKSRGFGMDPAVISARADFTAASHDFLQAAVSRFSAPQGGEPQPFFDDNDVLRMIVVGIRQGTETDNGEQATINIHESTFHLQKIGNEWKFNLGEMWKSSEVQNKATTVLFPIATQATREITQRIASGAIPDWESAKTSYVTRLKELVASNPAEAEAMRAAHAAGVTVLEPPAPWQYQRGQAGTPGIPMPGAAPMTLAPLPAPVNIPHPSFQRNAPARPMFSRPAPRPETPAADWNPRAPVAAKMPQWSNDSQHPPDSAATEMVGGKGGGPFSNPGVKGKGVMGFRYVIGSWNRQPVIQRLDPIVPIESGQPPVQWPANSRPIVARIGYAVAGLLVDYDDTNVVAVKVIFMRQTGGHLDPKQQYTSDWIGTPANRNQTQLAGKGTPVIGTFGRQGLNLAAIGLILESSTHLSPMLGSSDGGGPFVETGDGEKPVVGFRYTLGHWDVPVIRQFRPLYDPAGNDPLPTDLKMDGAATVLARDGYIATGLQVESDNTNVIAIRVVFARYKDRAVDPQDTYTSDWIGKLVGRNQTEIGGHGAIVTGVFGRQGLNLASIGLILKGAG